MEKLNLTKKYKAYYSAKKHPELIDIPAAQYISICGKGDPAEALFLKKTQALYAVAYTVKFLWKEKGKDFVVPKLEGLWWYDETKYKNVQLGTAPGLIPRSDWEYQILIRMPEYVTKEDIKNAVEKAFIKKNINEINEVKYFKMTEGKCVQIMHLGPYTKEKENLLKMQYFCIKNNLLKNGKHHEIYLNDPRKTAPEKLKTILREPVK